MKQRAFTLIEVVVVAAILMILGGIAYSAMASSRESARQRSCASNLRQIGLALRMYADDYGGIEPTVGLASRDFELGLPPAANMKQFVDGYVRVRSAVKCPNYSGLPGAMGVMTYWWGGSENDQMPESTRFSQMVKKRGDQVPVVGCEWHHPQYDLAVEPRWTLKRVLFLRLSGAVESRMKPVREEANTW